MPLFVFTGVYNNSFDLIRRIFFFSCLLGMLHTHAQQKNTSLKQSKSEIKLLQSTVQRTMPGMPGKVITSYNFILVWKNKLSPESFFWRGQNGWLTCSVQKVHAAGKKQKGIFVPDAAGVNARIHKGDTLELKPITGGRFEVPAEIPDTVTNTLFFKTSASGWMYYPVKKITQKQDIVLP